MKKRKNEAKLWRPAVGFLVCAWYAVLLSVVLIAAFTVEIHAENGISIDDSHKAENRVSIGDSHKAENRISIDDSHQYEGMDSPFSKGYEPAIQKNTMTLVVPFLSDANMEKERITVGVDFENEPYCPFYYKNYRKQVKLSEEGIYLYRCRIRLKKDRVNGQYPLHLWAEGKEGEHSIRQEFTIYVEITDGRARVGDAAPGEGPAGKGGGNPPDQTEPDDENLADENLPFGESGQANEGALEPSGSSGEEKNSQPRLIISQNSLQGKALDAGSSAAWTVMIQNCSRRHAVENIKVTLLTDSKDIVFEKTAWYFEKAAAKAEMELTQNITAVKKASAEPVQVQFQIEYEDTKGNGYTSTEQARLLVSQPQQAKLASLSFPEQVYAADTEFLSFQVQNTGLSPIYNVKVRLKAKGLFPQQEAFLGNIEGGTSADGEQKVFVGTLDMDEDGNVIENDGEKYGDTAGEVILSYENEQGEVTEQKLEIHTAIREAETVKLEIEEQKPQTNQWWVTIIILVIFALMLVIIWLYLRMRHYRDMGKQI